ncbi:MAG: hypothetical protein GYB31_08585 [Bacteroidetes bacterium]|nr:hypothetical protein [Bacteroidota bacterium]
MYLVTYDDPQLPEMRARDWYELVDWFRENGEYDLINWDELERTGSTESSCTFWKIEHDPGYGYDAHLLNLFAFVEDDLLAQVYESDPGPVRDPDQLNLF